MPKIGNGFQELAEDSTVHLNQQGQPFFLVGAANILMRIDGPGGLLVMEVNSADDKTLSNAERMRIAQHMKATLLSKGYYTGAYDDGCGPVVAISELRGEPRTLHQEYRDVREATEKAAEFLKTLESTGVARNGSTATGRS
jgi:hypothetical protein